MLVGVRTSQTCVNAKPRDLNTARLDNRSLCPQAGGHIWPSLCRTAGTHSTRGARFAACLQQPGAQWGKLGGCPPFTCTRLKTCHDGQPAHAPHSRRTRPLGSCAGAAGFLDLSLSRGAAAELGWAPPLLAGSGKASGSGADSTGMVSCGAEGALGAGETLGTGSCGAGGDGARGGAEVMGGSSELASGLGAVELVDGCGAGGCEKEGCEGGGCVAGSSAVGGLALAGSWKAGLGAEEGAGGGAACGVLLSGRCRMRTCLHINNHPPSLNALHVSRTCDSYCWRISCFGLCISRTIS